MRKHECDKFEDIDMGNEHGYPWGAAIDNLMWYAGGHWWIGNDEYASSVIYCPYCGIELDTLLENSERGE